MAVLRHSYVRLFTLAYVCPTRNHHGKLLHMLSEWALFKGDTSWCTGVNGAYYTTFQSSGDSPVAHQWAGHVAQINTTVPGGLNCNPFNIPSLDATIGNLTNVWPQRCLLPCVQYGLFDEPYFTSVNDIIESADYISDTTSEPCPCVNSTVYTIVRDYSSVLMSEWVCSLYIETRKGCIARMKAI